MSPTLDKDQFLRTVRGMWADGARQQDIADELGRSLSAVRSRLAQYGYKFGRAGKLVPIRAEPIEQPSAQVA